MYSFILCRTSLEINLHPEAEVDPSKSYWLLGTRGMGCYSQKHRCIVICDAMVRVSIWKDQFNHVADTAEGLDNDLRGKYKEDIVNIKKYAYNVDTLTLSTESTLGPV